MSAPAIEAATSATLQRDEDRGKAERLLSELAAACPLDALRSVRWDEVIVLLETRAGTRRIECPRWVEEVRFGTLEGWERWERVFATDTPPRRALLRLYQLCWPFAGSFEVRGLAAVDPLGDVLDLELSDADPTRQAALRCLESARRRQARRLAEVVT